MRIAHAATQGQETSSSVVFRRIYLAVLTNVDTMASKGMTAEFKTLNSIRKEREKEEEEKRAEIAGSANKSVSLSFRKRE